VVLLALQSCMHGLWRIVEKSRRWYEPRAILSGGWISRTADEDVSWRANMDKWTFGITLLVIGAGGTFITLGILILFTNILKKVFPLSAEQDTK